MHPSAAPRWSRRRFLGAVAAVPVAGWVAPRLDPEVLIVGGGLSGLRTLDLLRRGGVDARLLEANSRLGGRLWTLREGTPGGAMVEMGGERITDGYRRVQALVRELGLELEDYPAATGAFGWRSNGHVTPFRRPAELPEAVRAGLTPSEADCWPFQLHQRLVDPGDPPDPADPRTALAWLQSRGLSPHGETFVRAFCALPVAVMSAREFWESTVRDLGAGTTRTLRGGVDALALRLAARHEPWIHRATEASSVAFRDGGVEVADQRGRLFRARRLVLALPLLPLRRLRFSGGRPGLIERWCRGREVAAEIRVHGDHRESELNERDQSAYTFGLEFPRVTWARPERSGEGRRVLSTVALHDEVDQVRALLEGGEGALREHWRRALPHITSLGETVIARDLNADPRIGGTFPYTLPGAGPRPSEVREGSLVLAGGDCSTWPGSIEGALAAAEAAIAALRS